MLKNGQFLQNVLGMKRSMYVYKQRRAQYDHIYIYIFSKLSWRISCVSASIYLISSQVANSWWMMMI